MKTKLAFSLAFISIISFQAYAMEKEMGKKDVPEAKFYVIKPPHNFDKLDYIPVVENNIWLIKAVPKSPYNFDETVSYITKFEKDLYVIKALEKGEWLEVSKESKGFEYFKRQTHTEASLPKVLKIFYVKTKGPSRKLTVQEYLNLVRDLIPKK